MGEKVSLARQLAAATKETQSWSQWKRDAFRNEIAHSIGSKSENSGNSRPAQSSKKKS
ncbi:MAG: hypothetical protein GY791_04150 [Alphaproteobacteria bacterium]|nr:hypothetical protein [Alphaproteobacteria bacterium]